MVQKMKTVEKALRRWQNSAGRMPEQGEESTALEAKLSAIAGNNPYAEFEERLAAEIKSKSPTAQGQSGQSVNSEPGQSDEMARKKLADDESWQYIKMTPPATPTQKVPTVVKIKVDLALSQFQMRNYLNLAPDTWSEPAGTITIIHNTEKFFLIWGSGVDGKPLKAPGQTGPLMLHSFVQ